MIAITGANGLLGNFILQKFHEEKIAVIGLKREGSDLSFVSENLRTLEWRNADVCDSNSLLESLKGIDTLIHTAAIVSFDPRAKEKIYNTNVEGTRHVVNTCLSLGVKHLIFISSVAALGRKKGLTMLDENNQWVESDLNSDYAKSKYLSELEVFRGQEEGLRISIVNPSVILAPANPGKSSAQIFNYVQKERLFYADGTVNFVDVRDVAEIVFRLHKEKITGEKFIASAGHVELKTLMDEIAIRFKKRPPSVKINARLLLFAAWLEEMRCRVTGSETLISRQTVRMPKEKFQYQNQKSIVQLGMKYRSLEETLDWCCQQILGRSEK